MHECLQLDNHSNSLGAFFENHCNEKINFKYYDQGSCRNGCGDTVRGNAKVSALKTRGQIRTAACVWPDWPMDSSGKKMWQGQGSYSCGFDSKTQNQDQTVNNDSGNPQYEHNSPTRSRSKSGLGLDLAKYCIQKYGYGTDVFNNRSDAYSWRCITQRSKIQINMDDACQLQYGRRYKAELKDRYDSYTWSCYE